MRKMFGILALTSALAVVALGSTSYAQENQTPSGQMMDGGMMKMMTQMSEMMESCNKMMQNHHGNEPRQAPNDNSDKK